MVQIKPAKAFLKCYWKNNSQFFLWNLFYLKLVLETLSTAHALNKAVEGSSIFHFSVCFLEPFPVIWRGESLGKYTNSVIQMAPTVLISHGRPFCDNRDISL